MKSHKKLAKYLRKTADRMGLVDWQIWLDEEGPEGRPPSANHVYGGLCDVTWRRHAATIRIHEGWREWGPAQIRYVIVHELVHCHFAVLQEHHAHAQRLMSQSEWLMFDNMFDDAMEHHIDAVAQAWAQTLPLPE